METLINSQLKTAAAINRTASPYTFIKLTLNNRQGYITAARLTTINWKAPNIINTAGRVPYRLTSCQKNGVMVPTRAGINLKKSKYIKPLVRCLPISFIFVSPLCFPLKLFFGLFQRSDSYVPPNKALTKAMVFFLLCQFKSGFSINVAYFHKYTFSS
jgi:hypothetical protein